MTIGIGYDPGTATGGYAVLCWTGRQRPEFMESSRWKKKSDDPAVNLRLIRDWLGLAPLGPDPEFFAVEDQRWSRIPGKLQGRTNADSSGPMMAQSVAMAWGAERCGRVFLVQPQSARRSTVGKGSKFSCPAGVTAASAAKARRQHDKRVEAIQHQVIRAVVRGVPAVLSEHESDAIAVCLEGYRQWMAVIHRAVRRTA